MHEKYIQNKDKSIELYSKYKANEMIMNPLVIVFPFLFVK